MAQDTSNPTRAGFSQKNFLMTISVGKDNPPNDTKKLSVSDESGDVTEENWKEIISLKWSQ